MAKSKQSDIPPCRRSNQTGQTASLCCEGRDWHFAVADGFGEAAAAAVAVAAEEPFAGRAYAQAELAAAAPAAVETAAAAAAAAVAERRNPVSDP